MHSFTGMLANRSLSLSIAAAAVLSGTVTEASTLTSPLYVPYGGSAGGKIDEFTVGGATVSTSITGQTFASSVAFDSAGDEFISAYSSADVYEIPVSGGSGSVYNTSGASVPSPYDVALDSQGNVYVATNNKYIEEISSNGFVSTFATTAESGIISLAIDSAGDVFFTSNAGNGTSKPGGVYEIPGSGGLTNPSGTVKTVATGINSPQQLALDGNGDIFVASYDGSGTAGASTVIEISPSGSNYVTSTFASNISTSAADGNMGLAFDGQGNLFADFYNTTNSEYGVEEIGQGGTVLGTPVPVGYTSGSTYYIAFDVPEPASASLCGVGLIAAGLRRRRRVAHSS